jgi:mitogen-activated protein kinase 1/3
MFRNRHEGTPITNPSPRINFDLIKKSKLLRRKSKKQNTLGKELPAERSDSEGSKSILRKFKRSMSGSVLNTKSKLPPQPPYAQQQSHFPLVQKQQNHKVQHSQYASMTQTDAIAATVSRDDDFSKMGKMMSNDENDHQTATTAATNSYSLDDGSTIISESGTEIIMPSKGSGMMVDGKHRSTTPYAAHSFKAGSHLFTVDTKYSLIRVVGSGAYGVVISAHDTSTNKKVAIKMVPRAFHDEVDAKRILREIKLLKHLKHENIISLLDMMPPLAHHVEDFNDVYIVADLMETDLHRIIYSKQPLTIDHVQYFVYQILRALKYIHSANILHRDLKPSNLLVNSNCDLKVCDLGLARGVMPEDDKNAAKMGGSMLLTEYVVTRWYRAPEIMLACHEYSKPIDVWSIGCIFAELLQRKPYFPGDDYIDQVRTLCLFCFVFMLSP